MSDESPHYTKIGSSFIVGFKEAHGPIIASRDGFYLTIERSGADIIFGSMFGIVGKAISSSLSTTHPLETDLADLPDEITTHPDWPIKKNRGRVVFIPREAIQRLAWPWWGGLRVYVQENKFSISASFFARTKILATLNSMGYQFS